MVPVSLFLSGRTDGRTDGRRPFRSDASVTPRERGPSPEGGREIGEQERENRTNTDPMQRRERMGVMGNHYLHIMDRKKALPVFWNLSTSIFMLF